MSTGAKVGVGLGVGLGVTLGVLALVGIVLAVKKASAAKAASQSAPDVIAPSASAAVLVQPYPSSTHIPTDAGLTTSTIYGSPDVFASNVSNHIVVNPPTPAMSPPIAESLVT